MGGGTLAALVIAVGVFLQYGANRGRQSDTTEATYVGRDACAACHDAENTLWSGSHHDLAMQATSMASTGSAASDGSHTRKVPASRSWCRYPPLVRAGITPEPLIMNIDLAPTLLELGGSQPVRPLHGRSLVPLLRGETPPDWRSSILIEYYSDTVFRRIVTMGYKAVRTDRYKYINYLELEGMDEMYDLETDPFELNNVIDDPEYGTILDEMKVELQRLLDTTT